MMSEDSNMYLSTDKITPGEIESLKKQLSKVSDHTPILPWKAQEPLTDEEVDKLTEGWFNPKNPMLEATDKILKALNEAIDKQGYELLNLVIPMSEYTPNTYHTAVAMAKEKGYELHNLYSPGFFSYNNIVLTHRGKPMKGFTVQVIWRDHTATIRVMPLEKLQLDMLSTPQWKE